MQVSIAPPLMPKQRPSTHALKGCSPRWSERLSDFSTSIFTPPQQRSFSRKYFSHRGDATVARLQSLATFAIAFIARPIGSAVFGQFGDRAGRKVTLVASLLTMSISTVVIDLLPG